MTLSAQTGASSPLIAGASSIHDDEFRDVSDDDLMASNLLHFSPTPDDLQSLTGFGSNQQKAFLDPQELIANVGFPDSPNGSLPDSSSDSTASIKRTGSAASAKASVTVAGRITTDELDDSMDWGNRDIPDFNEDDSGFPFTREDEPLDMNMFSGFVNDREDAFMSQAFDFPPAPSANLDATPSGHTNIPSPSMPANETNGPANEDLPIPTHDEHQKKNLVSGYNLDDLADLGLTIFSVVLNRVHGRTNQRGVARTVANVKRG